MTIDSPEESEGPRSNPENSNLLGGLYEMVSRRDRPPGPLDEAYEAFSLVLEDASGHLRSHFQKMGHSANLDQQKGILLCSTVEALGLLRDSNRPFYTALIADLFHRDPAVEEIRATHINTMRKMSEEIAKEVFNKTFKPTILQNSNRSIKFMTLWIAVGAVTSIGGMILGRTTYEMSANRIGNKPIISESRIVPVTPAFEECLKKLDSPSSQ